MLSDLDKSKFTIKGEHGLPEGYPIPQGIKDLLFYIQRNLNKNTIVYTLNFNPDGFLNEYFPMNVFWIKYTEGGIVAKLNYLQTKAFGYTSKKIDNNTFEFIMDSHKKLKFFIVKNEQNDYNIISKVNDIDAKLSNIYVYANEFGLFPKMEYIEMYGAYLHNAFPCYEKIAI